MANKRSKKWCSGQFFKCPICNECLHLVLNIHAEKHDMSLSEYTKKFPESKNFILK